MARISDLQTITTPADNNVIPVSDGQVTKIVSIANLQASFNRQASTTSLGSVKVGSGLTISDTGVLSVRNYSSYILPPATSEVLGGIRVGAGLTISDTSVLSVDYELPVATSTVRGGVKVGSGINVTEDGVISTSTSNIAGGDLGDIPYQLTANQTTLLAGNITTVKKFLAQTGTGTVSRAPVWSSLVANDVGLGNVTNESKLTMFDNPTFTGTVTATSITSGSNSTRGDIVGNWYIDGQLRATFADLAEKYSSDAEYAPGTVVIFGGSNEITVTEKYADTRVAGAISTNPAYVMNEGSSGLIVALRGRIPVNVVGPIKKGDLLVTSNIPGFAQAAIANYSANAVFAKSLEDKLNDGPGTVEAVVL